MRTKADPVEDYLARLDRALAPLPRERRREIVEEISDHIAAARAELPAGDEAALRTTLDRLGDPEQIAVDARDRFGVPARERGWLEIGAIVLLLVGGLFAGIGWVAGAVLLWSSSIWTLRDKLIGTLVVPGGLVSPFFLLFVAVGIGEGGSCVETDTAELCKDVQSDQGSVLWTILFVTLLLAPIFTAVYLARRSRRLSAG